MSENETIRHAKVDRKVKSRNEKNKVCEKGIIKGNGYEQLLRGDSDEVDLDSLLKVVNGLSDLLNEEEGNTKKKRTRKHKEILNKKCIETAVCRYNEGYFRDDSRMDRADTTSSRISTASTMRTRSRGIPQLFGPPDNFPEGRKNMSFTNETVREIDMENQRLLREIIHKKPTSVNKGIVQRPSSSAINRLRRQQEIEKENLKFLQKLQSVKPTKSISRDYLLAEHQRILERSNRKPNISKEKRKSLPPSPSNDAPDEYSDDFDDTESVASSNK